MVVKPQMEHREIKRSKVVHLDMNDPEVFLLKLQQQKNNVLC